MEEEQSLDNPWCQLVSIGDEEEVIPVVGERLSIGRKRELADLVIPDNKHVSGCHCVLSKTPKATLKDTSTNGTLLNNKRVQRNVQVELCHNDIITLVLRKDDPSLNVAFRFELNTSGDGLGEVDATLTYETDDTLELSHQEETGKEGEEERTREGPVGKKRALEGGDEGTPDAKIAPAISDSCQTAGDTVPATLPNDGAPGGETSKPALAKMDSMAETLICEICQELLHDCVSLQPCLHSYCAGCYSQWMATSPVCPSCRNKVQRISRNHIVNNLVAAFLRANPDKKRPQEDLEELDAKNKITRDMLYPKRGRASNDDYDNDDDDDDDTDEDSPPYSLGLTSLGLFGLTPSATPILTLCRQCPNYTSSQPLPPSPHTYTCDPATSHVLCQCCLRPMPNRNSSSIPQKCDLCHQHFCHMYWTCSKPGCLGCLAEFKDLNFRPTCLNGILGNAYECTILKNYFDSKGLSIRDFVQACCAKMSSGDYTCALSHTTICCHSCALKSLKDLAYQYRRDISSDDLPLEVTRRVDCYWGKECRTQYAKPEHARKFNHVCEKTRQA